MNRTTVSILILSAAMCIGLAIARAADKPLRPGRLPSDERKALVQGLRLSVQQTDKVDTRRARLAALHVPAGQGPTTVLEPGQVKARLSG